VLVGSYIWKNLGYTVLLWLTGIMSVSSAVIDAARVDGANDRQILFRIILPELKPTLYTITIISFLNSFKVFREAYLVAGAYPDQRIYLLQHLFNNWFVNMDLDKMAAAAVIVFSVIFAAIMLLRKAWDKGEQL
jgi:multiple sugar transport system permease protein